MTLTPSDTATASVNAASDPPGGGHDEAEDTALGGFTGIGVADLVTITVTGSVSADTQDGSGGTGTAHAYLQVWDGSAWQTIKSASAQSLLGGPVDSDSASGTFTLTLLSINIPDLKVRARAVTDRTGGGSSPAFAHASAQITDWYADIAFGGVVVA